MPIVSISLPEELMNSVEVLQKSGAYTGRSELIRASIRLFLDAERTRNSLEGQISAVLVITHDRLYDESVTNLKHEYEDIVKTHIHNQLDSRTCAELLLVEGDGNRVSSMTKSIQKEDKVKSVKLLVI